MEEMVKADDHIHTVLVQENNENVLILNLFTEAIKWSKHCHSHKITSCLYIMSNTFQSSFKITISFDSYVKAMK